jgi:hypothetical protein
MKLNTLIRLPDGREGRTVYHNLDGYGIRWGRELADPENLPPPDAMLREPYPSATVECVGRNYEVLAD